MTRVIKEARFAELRYEKPDGTEWLAVIYKSVEGWELRVGAPSRMLPGGQFKNSKAIEKFVRRKGSELERQGAQKTADTLYKLKNASPWSLVPNCYEPIGRSDSMGRGLSECVACPYRSECGEPTAHLKVEKTQENEDAFRARLQEKLKAQWGENDS